MSEQGSGFDDPYQRFLEDETKCKNLIANDRSSKFSRKFKKFKDEMTTKKTYFLYGGMQGFAIGCLAGLGIGIVSAIQVRRFIVIPLSMIGSGLFFSGVMAFGSIIRSADVQTMKEKGWQEIPEGYSGAAYIQSCREKLV